MNDAKDERSDRDTAVQTAPALTLLAADAVRCATAAARSSEPVLAKPEERIPLFWRIFGGTLLSIAALVVVTLYQQFTSSINEMRNDMVRLHEAEADAVKKDEFNSRITTLWTGLSDAKAAGAGVAALREKETLHDQQLKQSDDDRKELLRELQQLRERVARLEAQHASGKPAKVTAPDIPD
jgi:hypothetical protein